MKVRYLIPVLLVLVGCSESEPVSLSVDFDLADLVVTSDSSTEASGILPIIYVDGVRIEGGREALLEEIDPEKVERIEVLKGEAAVRLLGEEAASGVIQIYMKDN